MSSSRETIRNGQAAQYLSQNDVYFGKKNSGQINFAIPLAVLFAVTCVTFVGFLYYLDVKWSAEIRNFNERVTRELKIYDENINVKLKEYSDQIEQLNIEIAECRDKNKSPLHLGGEIMKFKGVTIQNMEEYPLIEDIQPDGLLDISKNKTNSTRMEDPLGRINSTRTSDKEQIELFKRKLALLRENSTVLPPADALRDNDESVEGEEEEDSEEMMQDFYMKEMLEQQGRQKRSAELATSGGLNLIDKSPEVFDRNQRSNQTEFRKTSSQKNKTTSRVDNSECNGTPCEEPRKLSLLQKNTNERSSKIKKSTSTRDTGSSAFSETEEDSIDITETRRTVIAAHFGGDSTKYKANAHPNYEGNFHVRHPTGEYEDWQASPWFEELNMNRHFSLMNGNITVHSSGLYFVYAQILYSDLSDVNGYEIYLNNRVVLQCITTTYSFKNVTNKANSCYTGGVIKCNQDDKIFVKTTSAGKRIMLEATRSFVGLFKIGEFQSLK